MSKIGLIIKREYTSRVRKRAFIVITVLVPLLIVGLAFLAMWLSLQSNKQYKVLVVDPRNLCEEKVFVGNVTNPPAEFYFYVGELGTEEFRDQPQFQEYDVVVGVGPNVITNKHIDAFYREKPGLSAEKYIRNRLELRLEEYFALDKGLSLAEYREIRQEFAFTMQSVDKGKQDTTAAQMVGLGFSIFIFIFIMIYAGQVMRGVIEEKTSRVVEILVSSVKPFQLMMGKIIGIGLVGLTQFLIWIALIGITLMMMRFFVFSDVFDPGNWAQLNEMQNADLLQGQTPNIPKSSELIMTIYTGIPWGTLLMLFVLYFLGGYILYGSLFAMIGSAVDSETDSQQVMLPVMLPLFFSYIISISIINNPGGPAAIWFSQIPLSSPIIMLQRVASGTVGLWEVIVSLVLLVLASLFTIWAAAKIYRVGILMYGKKASWKEIFKWMRF
jgi:ABC-2 type transport system permease protein